jgi:hypothetical protein
MGYNWYYYFKKAYALYPGMVRPVAADVLLAHYERRRRRRSPLQAMLDAATGSLFHAWIPWRSRRVQRRLGLDDAWRKRATAIAHAAFADPNDIALFRIDSEAALRAYIRRFEDAAINKLLNPLGWTDRCALADKRRFAERCSAAGLPHPQTIAISERRKIHLFANPDGRELVAKPVDGEGGSGVRMLGMVADGHALLARHSELRRSGTVLVVQPRIHVHPGLADLALSALPTVRIVTMRDEHGRPEVVSATFRCPTDPEARVDNMKAGGLISPVDLDSGTLGVACFGYGGDDHASHPVTGAVIAGRVLPDWVAATALAVRAHAEAFSDYVLIGWDVAISNEGPLLIEGNGKPGVLMPQRAARRGLAQGRYGALLSYHLASLSRD